MAGAPVRTRRLFGPTTPVPATTTLAYTVPDERTAIIRGLFIDNLTAVANLAVLFINGTTNTDECWRGSIPGNTTVEIPDSIVLNPGDTLYIRASVGSATSFTGFGSLLDGAPE